MVCVNMGYKIWGRCKVKDKDRELREILDGFIDDYGCGYYEKTIPQIKALVIESLGEDKKENCTNDDLGAGWKDGYNYCKAEMKEKWQ